MALAKGSNEILKEANHLPSAQDLFRTLQGRPGSLHAGFHPPSREGFHLPCIIYGSRISQQLIQRWLVGIVHRFENLRLDVPVFERQHSGVPDRLGQQRLVQTLFKFPHHEVLHILEVHLRSPPRGSLHQLPNS